MREDIQDWYFTFKKGTKYFGRYVKIFGTKEKTRQQAYNKYGNDINFQYSEDAFECCNKIWQTIELGVWHITGSE